MSTYVENHSCELVTTKLLFYWCLLIDLSLFIISVETIEDEVIRDGNDEPQEVNGEHFLIGPVDVEHHHFGEGRQY